MTREGNAPPIHRGGGGGEGGEAAGHLRLDGRARGGALSDQLRVPLLLLTAPVRCTLGVWAKCHQREVVLKSVVPEILRDGAEVEQVPGSL